MGTDCTNSESTDDQAQKFKNTEDTNILCRLCGRTSENGIRCTGMCLGETDY